MVNSLRFQVRVALLTLFALGSHGSLAEVQSKIKKFRSKTAQDRRKAGAGTIAVQVSQVRGELMEQVGITIDQESGRLSKETVAEITRQLKLKTVAKRVNAALKDAGIDPASLRSQAAKQAA